MVNTEVREYVKVADAAEILGVSQGTVRAWAEAGKIPMHKNPANRYRLLSRTDLEAFLNSLWSRNRSNKLRGRHAADIRQH